MTTYQFADFSVFGQILSPTISDTGEIAGRFGVNGDFIGYFINGPALTTGVAIFQPPIGVPDDPNAAPGKTFAEGENSAGTIVGYYFDTSSHAHGFIFHNGAFTTVDNPNGTDTFLNAINNSDEIVGYYLKSGGPDYPFAHGLIDTNGTLTTLDFGSNISTYLTGINDAGAVVGIEGLFDFFSTFAATPGTVGTAQLAYTPDIASLIVWKAEGGAAPPYIQPTYSELQTLISFSNSQHAYGQQIGVMDPVAYTYEALGATLSGSPHFQQKVFTNLPSDADFVNQAYNSVFGHAGSAGQLQVFANQLHFVESLYTTAEIANADLVARGAVYGTMLGLEAEMTQVPIVGTAHV